MFGRGILGQAALLGRARRISASCLSSALPRRSGQRRRCWLGHVLSPRFRHKRKHDEHEREQPRGETDAHHLTLPPCRLDRSRDGRPCHGGLIISRKRRILAQNSGGSIKWRCSSSISTSTGKV